MFDTGSNFSIINPVAVDKYLDKYRTKRNFKLQEFRDVLDNIETYKYFTIKRFKIGRNKWHEVIFQISDMKPLSVMGIEDKSVVLVGMDILKDRSFGIDYSERRLYMTPPLDINGEMSADIFAFLE